MVQYSTVKYSTNTVQYNTLHYSTVQYSTVQYSTVQYSTVHTDRLSLHPKVGGVEGEGEDGGEEEKVHLKTHGSTSRDRG